MKKKVLVRGPALTSSGYGEHARLILRALRSRTEQIDLFFENINWGQTGFLVEDSEERRWMDFLLVKTQQFRQSGAQFDVSVQITIPPEWEKIAPVNIGVTAGIETTRIAPQWVEKCRVVDKIIVPSEHAKYAFDNTFYKLKNQQTGQEMDFRNHTPVEVVHYPVKSTVPQEIELDLDCDFNFLTVAQWGPRKNLDNTIRWFVDEFKGEEVGLVVKASVRKGTVGDRMQCRQKISQILSAYPDRKCKVYLVHGNMSEEEMCGLYSHPKIKAIVSTTHGEGFGLPLFEAVYNELPVIAPNWSGHIDFLYAPKKDKKGKVKRKSHFTKVDYDIAPIQVEAVWEGVLQRDSQWCFPKESSFKTGMRELYKNYGTRKSEAKKLAKYVRENFSQTISYDKIFQVINPESFALPKADVQEVEGISFCIPTNAAQIEKTKLELSSIHRTMKTVDIPYEIIVAGKISTFKDMDKLKLVDTPEDADGGMLAKLRNNAGDVAQYDTLVFVDDDFLFPDSWAKRLLEFSKEEGWSVLGNKILLPDGGRFWDRATINPHVLVEYTHSERDRNLYQTGGFWIMRKKIYDEIKWDSTLPINADQKMGRPNEDIDLSRRVVEAGHPLSFDKDNTVWHNDDKYIEFRGVSIFKERVTKEVGLEFFPPYCEEYKKLAGELEDAL